MMGPPPSMEGNCIQVQTPAPLSIGSLCTKNPLGPSNKLIGYETLGKTLRPWALQKYPQGYWLLCGR